jgi:hypothetical protein
MSWKRSLRNAVLGSAVLLGGMAVWSVPTQADSCGKVREEQRELNQAIARYGYWSPQAEHERRDLRNAEVSCGGYYYGDRDDRYWRGDWRKGGDRDDWRWRDRDDQRWRRGDGDHDRDDWGRHHDWDHDRH